MGFGENRAKRIEKCCRARQILISVTGNRNMRGRKLKLPTPEAELSLFEMNQTQEGANVFGYDQEKKESDLP